MTKPIEYGGAIIYACYSDSHAGWFAEVVEPNTGKSCHRTKVVADGDAAVQLAKEWIDFQYRLATISST